jgi:CubicO group peptidase (beta-lactamase class C family)
MLHLSGNINNMKILQIVFFFTFILACSKEESSEQSCNMGSIESEIAQELGAISTDVDFSFYIEREDGKNYSYNKGSSSLSTIYESASTSKWVSAAVILWVLENTPNFDLLNKVSDHYAWTMSTGDSLYNANLAQLLSFTSGLQSEANCLKFGIPSKSFDNCINDASGSIVAENESNSYTPGTSFYYSSSHLQVAGAMAVAASGHTDWQNVFTAFKVATGLFQNSTYSLPSVSNPRLAGGMTWTGTDYVSFLRAIYKNEIFGTGIRDEMFKDHVQSIAVDSSPAFDGLGEQWHYGLGVWLECQSSTYNCSSVEYYSSPGAYGAYPFMNLNKKFFGIVARQGSLGTFANGVYLYRSVKASVEKWAACK